MSLVVGLVQRGGELESCDAFGLGTVSFGDRDDLDVGVAVVAAEGGVCGVVTSSDARAGLSKPII